MKTREQLQAEFILLRNAKMTKGISKRGRDLYFDWLLDSDKLAELKSDEELIKAIHKMRDEE